MTRPLINISVRQAYLYAVFLVLYEFLTYIANDMIMPGMLSVVREFNGPESAVASSLTAYLLGGASLQILLGPLSDRYGRRPVMLFGVVCFLLCTAFIASSQSMDQFIAGRFLQGMGLCFITVIGYATLQEIFAEMDAIRLMAVMASVSILAPLIGPLLGAVFIHFYSWRYIFIFIGCFTLIALFGLFKFMPEPVGAVKRDGQLIARTSLAPKIIAGYYLQLFKNKPFLLASLALGFLGIPCLSWIALSPIILVKMAKLSLMAYGLWQIPVFGMCLLGNFFLAKLTHRYSLTQILYIASGILLLGLCIMFIQSFIFGGYLSLMPGLIMYFFGLAVINAPLSRFILFSTDMPKGTASALMAMLAMLINSIGVEAGNWIYADHSTVKLAFYCAMTGLISFLLLLLALYLIPKKEIIEPAN